MQILDYHARFTDKIITKEEKMTRFRFVGCAWKASCTISIQLRVTFGLLVSVYGKYSHLLCNHISEWRTKRLSSLSKMEICWVVRKILRTVFTTWWDNVGTESQNNDQISILSNKIFIKSAMIMILGEDPKLELISSNQIYDLHYQFFTKIINLSFYI